MRKTFEKGLVSICIPTYNGAEYIKETLESVLSQSYRNIEVIVNDDKSKDNTLEIVRSIKDDRIKIYENESNQGLAGNWNATVKRARGEYTKLMCQDDILLPNSLKYQVEALNKNSGVSCVIGNTHVINSNGKILFKRRRFSEDKIVSGEYYAKRTFAVGRNLYGEPPNLLYRTKLFYLVGGYDTTLKYTPDWDFALHISLNNKIYCLAKDVMCFRVSSTSETSRLMKGRKKTIMQDSMQFYDKYKDHPKLHLDKLDEIDFKLFTKAVTEMRFLTMSLCNTLHKDNNTTN